MQEVNVQVAVRVRPILPKEKNESICIKTISSLNQVILGKDRTYTYDHVFPSSSCQEDIYEKCVSNLVKSCLDGYNGTVFAYGQTGSGKTYTMGTSSDYDLKNEDIGLIPRIVSHVFNAIQNVSETIYRVRVSYLEVYKDELHDLLDFSIDRDPDKNLIIREDENNNTIVVGVVERECHSGDEVLDLLSRGSEYRVIGKTKMNEHSSRSHAIFTIIIEQEKSLNASMTDSLNIQPEFDGEVPPNLIQKTCGKLHCVDLAGSERANRTGNTGERFKESIYINTGLLALGNVICALGDPKKKAPHVPYRAAKITRLLKDSLGGNSRTLMICCVSPTLPDMDESLNALNFANRARNIRNKPVINMESNATKLNEMKLEIKVLREQLIRERTRVDISSVNTNYQVIGDTKNDVYITKLETDIETIKQDFNEYKILVDGAYDILKEFKFSIQLDTSQEKLISDWMNLVNNIRNKKSLSKVNSHMDKDQEINKLKAIIAKYEKDLHNDEEIFSDRLKENDDLQERLNVLESEKLHILNLLEQSNATVRCLKEKVFHHQEADQSTSIMNRVSEVMMPIRQRATSVPSHMIGHRLQMSQSPSRTLHTSPASFSSERMLKQVRLRGQMLYSMAEDEDDVISTYREEEDLCTDTEELAAGDQPCFQRLDRTRGTFRVDVPTNSQSLQNISLPFDPQTNIKLPLRRMSQLNIKTKNDLELSVKLKEQMIHRLIKSEKDSNKLNISYQDQIKKLQADKLANEALLNSRQQHVSNKILTTTLSNQKSTNKKKTFIQNASSITNQISQPRIGQNNSNNESSDEHRWIEEKLELLVEQRRVAEALQQDLEKREKLVAEKEAKLAELNSIKLKNLRASQALNQDILRLSVNLDGLNRQLVSKETDALNRGETSDVKELRRQRDELQEECDRLMTMVNEGQSLDEADQRRFIECEETVDALNAAIDYNGELIVGKSQTIEASSHNETEEIFLRMSRLNIQESKKILSIFLEKIVSLRNEKLKNDEMFSKLQAQSEEDQRTILQLESVVTKTNEQLEQKILQLRKQYDLKMAELTSESSNDFKSKIKELEKDLFYYKSCCRELKHKLRDLLNSTPTPRLNIDQNVTKPSSSKNVNCIAELSNSFTPRPPVQSNIEISKTVNHKRSSKIVNQSDDPIASYSPSYRPASEMVSESTRLDSTSRIDPDLNINDQHVQSYSSNGLKSSTTTDVKHSLANNGVKSKYEKMYGSKISKDSLITSTASKENTSHRPLNTPTLFDSLE